jgi:cold shock protein
MPKPWTAGSVQSWRVDEGWGVLTSPDLVGDVWVHFSSILGDGFRELATGEPVEFRYEDRLQDGYAHAATVVRRLGTGA